MVSNSGGGGCGCGLRTFLYAVVEICDAMRPGMVQRLMPRHVYRLFAFYFCNSYFASHDTAHMERVAIERRFRETHYKTKRISRRTYGRGEPYQQYYIEVRFEDGRTKKLSVKFDTYRRLKSQDTIQLKMERGLWGLPVIRRKGANIEVPHSGYRQTESILTRRLRESKY